METQDTIHDFWFGSSPSDAAVIREKSALWWGKDADTDAAMGRRFRRAVLAAESGTLDAWSRTPGGRLALILLTDQFPRNIFRGHGRSFGFDALARSWCLDGLRERCDRQLRLVERIFFYLPLEHSEDLDHQQRCLALFEELSAEAPAELKESFSGYLDYARRHHAIIARFGRFPHRNEALGRVSTDAELAFLREPGSRF